MSLNTARYRGSNPFLDAESELGGRTCWEVEATGD